MSDRYKINLNPNAKDEAHAMADAYKERLESVLKLRCPEHDKPPRLETVKSKLMLETCCDSFEKQVNEALKP
jgi:hypothetical protein